MTEHAQRLEPAAGPSRDHAHARRSYLREPGFYLAVLLAAWAFWGRVELIASKDTYVLHRDEAHLTKRAFAMLKNGDPNPHFFKYGSLPIYLTAAAMKVGASVAELNGTLERIEDVTSVAHPYYSHLAVSLPPRWLFALVSVLGLFAIGALGRYAFDAPAMWVAAPCALLMSRLYLHQSWTYANVDIIATALGLGALAHLMAHLDSPRLLHRAIVPALFCGAVTATKYNSGVLGLPFMIAILIGPRAQRWTQLAWLFGLSLLVYALCSPFSFIDHERFIADVRYEMHHYSTGHLGRDGDPGWPQLVYYWGVLQRDYGEPLLRLGGLGLVYGLLARPKHTLLVLAFPVTMVLHMATNRVHFPRTVLPAFCVLSVFIGLGAVAMLVGARKLGELVQRKLDARAAPSARFTRLLPAAVELVVAAALVVTAVRTELVATVRARHTAHPDSRGALSAWARTKLPRGCLLLIPTQVPFDPRPLAQHCTVRSLSLEPRKQMAAAKKHARAAAGRTFLIYPEWRVNVGRLHDRRAAAQWSTWFQGLTLSKPLVWVGEDPIGILSTSPTMGSPRLAVYRVDAWDS